MRSEGAPCLGMRDDLGYRRRGVAHDLEVVPSAPPLWHSWSSGFGLVGVRAVPAAEQRAYPDRLGQLAQLRPDGRRNGQVLGLEHQYELQRGRFQRRVSRASTSLPPRSSTRVACSAPALSKLGAPREPVPGAGQWRPSDHRQRPQCWTVCRRGGSVCGRQSLRTARWTGLTTRPSAPGGGGGRDHRSQGARGGAGVHVRPAGHGHCQVLGRGQLRAARQRFQRGQQRPGRCGRAHRGGGDQRLQFSACALLGRTASWDCWGYNASGQLATARPPHTTPGASGRPLWGDGDHGRGDHSCAVVGGGAIKCWGANASGQLGDGTNIASLVPVGASQLSGATAVSAGGPIPVRWSPEGRLGAGAPTPMVSSERHLHRVERPSAGDRPPLIRPTQPESLFLGGCEIWCCGRSAELVRRHNHRRVAGDSAAVGDVKILDRYSSTRSHGISSTARVPRHDPSVL